MHIADRVRAALTDELRKPEYQGNPNPLAGHCYVASEAMYFLGAGARGFKPMFIRHEGQPHWFLRDHNGNVLDLTASQFVSPIPYDRAMGKGFLTKSASKRAKIVMERVRTS